MWIHVNMPVLGASTGYHSVDTDSISVIFIEFGSDYAGVMATLKGGKNVCLFRCAGGESPGNKRSFIDEAKKIKDDLIDFWRGGFKHAEIKKIVWPDDLPKNENQYYQEHQVYAYGASGVESKVA